MIFSRVVNFQYIGASRYTGYRNCSIKLNLECGHVLRRKASTGVPLKARCRECENLSDPSYKCDPPAETWFTT